MSSILQQIKRGIASRGFIMSVCVLLFSMQYVHMDAGLFWRDPLAYYASGDFFYTFIISIYFGLLRFLMPLAAVLPMGMSYAEDVDSRFLSATLHRQKPSRYILTKMISAMMASALGVLFAIGLTVILYILTCKPGFMNLSMHTAFIDSPFGWRATPEYFHVFVLEAAGRLMLSAALWACVGLAFSALWPNQTFVIVSTLALAYTMDGWLMKLGGIEWTIAYIQAPEFSIVQSLTDPLIKQVGLLIVGMITCYALLSGALSAKLQAVIRKGKDIIVKVTERILPPQHLLMPHSLSATKCGRIWSDLRAFLSPVSIICTILITTLCIFLSSVYGFTRYTIGELLLGTFGGMGWADPQPDIPGIGKWLLLLLPPMMGVAYTLQRELGGRQNISVHRYGSTRLWWSSKAIASLLFSIVTVALMFAWTIVFGYLSGARGLEIYVADADGFRTLAHGILTTMFIQFLLQTMMWTQLQMLMHLLFADMRAGIIAYLLPVICMLMSFSNIETPRNMFFPVNWGMIFRTEYFCPNGYFLDNNEWLQLCSVVPVNAIVYQLILITIFCSLHITCSSHAKITTISTHS